MNKTNWVGVDTHKDTLVTQSLNNKNDFWEKSFGN